MQSQATTVTQYINELPADRRAAIKTLRAVIKKNLPAGYQETMQYGMISYVVPLKLYPEGYLGKKDTPLPYISLASQKNHLAVYLMAVYGDPKIAAWFAKAYKASGKKLDMGKSCLRFKKIEDVPLDVLGQAVAKFSVKDLIKMHEAGRRSRK